MVSVYGTLYVPVRPSSIVIHMVNFDYLLLTSHASARTNTNILSRDCTFRQSNEFTFFSFLCKIILTVWVVEHEHRNRHWLCNGVTADTFGFDQRETNRNFLFAFRSLSFSLPIISIEFEASDRETAQHSSLMCCHAHNYIRSRTNEESLPATVMDRINLYWIVKTEK